MPGAALARARFFRGQMFKVQSSILLFSICSLLLAGEHFGVFVAGTLLPAAAILLGLTEHNWGDDDQEHARALTLINICFLNDLALAFRFNSFEYANNLSLGSLSFLAVAAAVTPSVFLTFAFAGVYSTIGRSRRLLIPCFGVALIGFAPGILRADVELDHLPQGTSFANVTGKGIPVGGARMPGHELELTSTEAGGVANSRLRVNWAFWDRVQAGDRICFYDHRGALGVAWRRVDICR